jgi:hypothetical protein
LPEFANNRERVGRALDLLRNGLISFVEREMKARYGPRWVDEVGSSVDERQQAHLLNAVGGPEWDCTLLLAVILNQWYPVFQNAFVRAPRNVWTLADELRQVRNEWAHQKAFSAEDAYRAVDSVDRLLRAVSAPQADEVKVLKMELLDELRKEMDVSSSMKSPEIGHIGHLRDFGFSETKEREISEIVRALQHLGGVNVRVEEKGEDVLVVGDFDDGAKQQQDERISMASGGERIWMDSLPGRHRK